MKTEIEFKNEDIIDALIGALEGGREFDPEEMDADDSDVLFQFIVMGEIVFG